MLRLFSSGVRFYSTPSGSSQNIAVLLSGCGVYDGSEITEAVSALVNISRSGFTPVCFAPEKDQAHTVDHTTGNTDDPPRNVLSESARIARGDVKKLNDLDPSNFAALVVPGGFGVAKNLSNFAFTEADYEVDPEVERVLRGFRSQEKPIGLCCIAPILAAKIFPGAGLTMGRSSTDDPQWPFGGAAGRLTQTKYIECGGNEFHVDEKNLLVTSPAYMYAGKPHEAFDSAGQMVDGVISLLKANKKE